MKKNILFTTLILLLVFLSICLLYSKQIIQPEGLFLNELRNTDGSVTFTVRTVTYNGTYSPRNAGVIWITNSQNQFVKTVKIWAQSYRSKLVKWVASSGNNTTGAITSASLNNHQMHSVTWNGTNVSNVAVPDGDYKVNVEFAEHNATTNNSGKYKVITFTKGTAAIDQTIANETYFTDMHLVWAPIVTADGTVSGTIKNTSDQPIANALITVGSLSASSALNGSYSVTIAPGTYSVSCSANNYQMQNVNNVVVSSNQVTTTNFILAPIPDGTVSGLVTDSQNQPVSGATITAGSHSVISSETGTYTMQAFPGVYDIVCSAPNYQSQTQNNITISSEQTTTVNFNLSSVSNDDEVSVNENTILLQNYPNPFKQNTNVKYYLNKGSVVKLSVYNSKGKLVRTLTEGSKSLGWSNSSWNGKDKNGYRMPSGNYYIQLNVSGRTKTIAATLIN